MTWNDDVPDMFFANYFQLWFETARRTSQNRSIHHQFDEYIGIEPIPVDGTDLSTAIRSRNMFRPITTRKFKPPKRIHKIKKSNKRQQLKIFKEKYESNIIEMMNDSKFHDVEFEIGTEKKFMVVIEYFLQHIQQFLRICYLVQCMKVKLMQ